MPHPEAPASSFLRISGATLGQRTWAVWLGLLVLVTLGRAASAIDDLEAEEDIADLLPYRFPGPENETARDRPWALLPQVGYGPDTSGLAGLKLTDYDVGDLGVRLDLGATAALKGQIGAALSIGTSNLLDNRLVVLVRARFQNDPQREFFGLGNNDIGDYVTTNGIRDIGGGLTVGWRPFDRLAFNFQVASRKVDIDEGREHDDDEEPNTTPERFPHLVGVHGGVVTPVALSLVWTSRNDVMRPTRGLRVILKALHANRELLSDFEYSQFSLDAGYLRSFNHRRQVVGVRVNGQWIEAPRRRLPYWDQSELGGGDTLRGFYPHRFLGHGRVLVNLELRSRLLEFDFFDLWHVNLDGVLFGDGGRVFSTRHQIEEDFGEDDDIPGRLVDHVQYSYGVGVRIALAQALVARIDVGFSREETGLVFLSFGHTF